MKRLYLSKNKKLAGVCGGVADYFDIDPTLVRLAWVVLTIVTGVFPGILAYIVAAIVMPPQPEQASEPDTSGERPAAEKTAQEKTAKE